MYLDSTFFNILVNYLIIMIYNKMYLRVVKMKQKQKQKLKMKQKQKKKQKKKPKPKQKKNKNKINKMILLILL